MYVIPGLEVGVTPILQWLLLPPLTVWFARRQIAATEPKAGQAGATALRQMPFELGVACWRGGQHSANHQMPSTHRRGTNAGASLTSFVFLLDGAGGIELLPHSVYVALARTDAVLPRFAGKTFRLADWYVRQEQGERPQVISEWYGWVCFDGAPAFDPSVPAGEGRLERPLQGNVDSTALPSSKERARMQEALALLAAS